MAAAEQHHDTAPATVDPAERRYQGMLRMIGHVKDSLRFPLSKREALRVILMAGQYANPRIAKLDAGARALMADQDAEALLAVGSDEEPS